MTMRTPDRITGQIVVDLGWKLGTTLENSVALFLSRVHLGPEITAQQHRVGRYRLDFAWPDIQVALEADGWVHSNPETAFRDWLRDRELRNLGWLVLRVDASQGDEALRAQVGRVTQLVHALSSSSTIPWESWSRRAR